MTVRGYSFSDEVRAALADAREEAARLGSESVGTEHVLLALLNPTVIGAARVLTAIGADVTRMRDELESRVTASEPRDGTEAKYTREAKLVLERAMMACRTMGHETLGVEHLLVALWECEPSLASDVIDAERIRIEALRAEVAHAYPRVFETPE